MTKLSLHEFCSMVGSTVNDISIEVKQQFETNGFDYLNISAEKQNALIESIHNELNRDLSVSGKHRYNDWERGWSENLETFKNSGYNPESLLPKYYHAARPLRMNGGFIKPQSPEFEWNYSLVYRKYLFSKYLKDTKYIYEFGCGSCHNLTLLAELYPDKYLFGFDWASASVKILDLLRKHNAYNIHGSHFDFFSPDETISLETDSAVFTYHALEQLGNDFRPFVDFIIQRKPCVVLNVECLLELYDEKNDVDKLAIQYHKKRNYLSGFVSYLKKLEHQGIIKILDIRRTQLGCLFHEAYSHIAWKVII